MTDNLNSITNSKDAISSAYSALSFIEQLESCLEGLKHINDSIPVSYREELSIYIEKLQSLINLVDQDPDGAGVPELIKGIPLSMQSMSKIERLGLASQVIRMKEINRATIREISETLGISAQSVSRFLKYYESAPLSTKTRYQRASIFDTSTQYEEVGTMIYRQLARLENTDAENHVKYISELRQLLKAAHEWMDKVQTQNQMAEVKEAIVEILLTCLPEQREKIIRQFANIGIKGFRSINSIEGT